MSVVVSRNDGILPLAAHRSVALIGAFVGYPASEGDQVALDIVATAGEDFVFQAPGFAPDGSGDADLLRAGVALAAEHEFAVVFLGTPERRPDLPDDQRALLDAVLDVNPRTVVVLPYGDDIATSLDDRVRAVVDNSAPVTADGRAIADVLYGLGAR